MFNLLRLWLKRPLQRHHDWSFNRVYWQLRQSFLRTRFILLRQSFHVNHAFDTTKETIAILSQIVRAVIGQVVIALMLIVALEGLEHFVLTYGGAIGSFYFGPALTHRVGKALRSIVPDPAAYLSLLTTSAQIAGAFVALYFTAVTVVASANYARVKGNINALLFRAVTHNRYIQLVATFGVICLLLSMMSVLGYKPGVLSLLFLAGLGTISIFGFVVLGLQTLGFFDPTQLTKHLDWDIRSSIGAVTPFGKLWLDPSFQDYHHRQVAEALTTYENIVDLALKQENLRGQVYLRSAYSLLSLLQYYTRFEKQIPTESRWFGRVPNHVNWLTADYSVLKLALTTHTSPQPELVPDARWFAARVEIMLFKLLNALTEAIELEEAVSLCTQISTILRSMASVHAIDEVFSLFRRLRFLACVYSHGNQLDVAIPTVPSGPVEGVDEIPERDRLLLSLVDCCGLAFLNILLGLCQSLEGLTRDALSGKIETLRWRDPKSIYGMGAPRQVLRKLEVMRRRMDFEIQVEGRLVTEGWYLTQEIAAAWMDYLAAAFNALTDEMETTFADEVDWLIAAKKPVLAAAYVQRGLEACNKLAFYSQAVQNCLQDLSSAQRQPQTPSKPIDWDEIMKRTNKVRHQLVISLSKLVVPLGNLPISNRWPDYFGEAYSVLASECYSSLASGETDLFTAIFAPFAISCLRAHDRLRDGLTNYSPENLITLSVTPLEDLLDISGFAVIYSELDGPPFWAETKRVWDQYFERALDPQVAADYLSMIADDRRILGGQAPRSLIRMSWQQDFQRRLRERGLANDYMMSFGNPHVQKVRHPSGVIRIFAQASYTSYRAKDVFMVKYNHSRSDRPLFKLSSHAKDFAEALNREENSVTQTEEEIE